MTAARMTKPTTAVMTGNSTAGCHRWPATGCRSSGRRRRGDDVHEELDGGVDDLAERAGDDDGNGQFDHIALEKELALKPCMGCQSFVCEGKVPSRTAEEQVNGTETVTRRIER